MLLPWDQFQLEDNDLPGLSAECGLVEEPRRFA
jgi:hypothetical protein